MTGPVPKRLEAGNYFAEQRQFNLGLQANGVNFDQFLAVRGLGLLVLMIVVARAAEQSSFQAYIVQMVA